jgi:hypothetical protein
MKRIAFVSAIAMICMGFSAVMLAQDNPVVGTWKLNLEKSKFTSNPAPKNLTRTVSADGDKVKYVFTGEAADGSAMSYSFTVMYDGKDNGVTGAGMPYGADHIAIKRVSSHKYSATLKKDGKIVGTSTSTVSSDGKMTTLVMKSPAGSSTAVYDQQ